MDGKTERKIIRETSSWWASLRGISALARSYAPNLGSNLKLISSLASDIIRNCKIAFRITDSRATGEKLIWNFAWHVYLLTGWKNNTAIVKWGPVDQKLCSSQKLQMTPHNTLWFSREITDISTKCNGDKMKLWIPLNPRILYCKRTCRYWTNNKCILHKVDQNAFRVSCCSRSRFCDDEFFVVRNYVYG